MRVAVITSYVAAVEPKSTAEAPVKPVPEITTVFPPAVEPWLGATAEMAGAGMKVKSSLPVSGLVPNGHVTRTAKVPAVWLGAVAVIWVLEFTVYDVAAVPPKVTALAPVSPTKPEPVMTTEVPPPAGPEVGVKEVMAGVAVATADPAFSLPPVTQ